MVLLMLFEHRHSLTIKSLLIKLLCVGLAFAATILHCILNCYIALVSSNSLGHTSTSSLPTPLQRRKERRSTEGYIGLSFLLCYYSGVGKEEVGEEGLVALGYNVL